jgi:hypothetical protein
LTNEVEKETNLQKNFWNAKTKMSQLLLDVFGHTLTLDVDASILSVNLLKDLIFEKTSIPSSLQLLSCNSRLVSDDLLTSADYSSLPPIRISFRLLGGKGGFGALLRNQPKAFQKKTTNFTACRDLSGM